MLWITTTIPFYGCLSEAISSSSNRERETRKNLFLIGISQARFDPSCDIHNFGPLAVASPSYTTSGNVLTD